MTGQHDGLARTRLGGLTREADLLLALSRVRLDAAGQRRVHDFLGEHGRTLDWGLFIELACAHAVLPLVGRNLVKLRLAHSAEGRALAPYRWIYAYVYEGNRQRNLALRDEYAKVLRGLNGAGVDYAVRKGPVLVEGVYPDPGVRRMGDLDVLLKRESLAEFAAVAGELGYQQGHLSRNADTVVPFDRRTQMVWKVNLTNSTLPFLKPAQHDDVEAFVLDPCFDLFQPRSGRSAEAAKLLARSVPTTHFGEPSHMLDRVDQIVDMCVQLHVEATTLMYIELGKDLTLLKFLDLVELLRLLSPAEVAVLAERVSDFGCADSVHYALRHAGMVYPGDVDPELIARFDTGDEEVLDLYGALDDKPQRWDRDFAERLFDTRRWASLTEHSTVPGPRAVV
ncbi:Uncharacterised nucleotidyltransferase [Amycolatopsis xylanica]|uniref:Uncharacterized nucleotidyltransferase n=1 Tax=Amycolatopsis xylanica TaxID=589385 RepID=A0A1H3SD32_9PSEU|nr:nucleotidyltransferase family protein [Amycolatopsis xylanica]SDZ35461.1 Uncharacterised nucleotidyltransferase [Amycolatopsis xylanica]